MTVAWRLLSGNASEKGRDAAGTREVVAQALERGGPDGLGVRLAEAWSTEGPRIA